MLNSLNIHVYNLSFSYRMPFGVSKINGTLLFKDLGGYENRNPSTAWCIYQADKKYNFSDFNEIIIDTKAIRLHLRFRRSWDISLMVSFILFNSFSNYIFAQERNKNHFN